MTVFVCKNCGEIIESDDQFINYCKLNRIDIVINDILDTTESYIRNLKKCVERVINEGCSGLICIIL